MTLFDDASAPTPGDDLELAELVDKFTRLLESGEPVSVESFAAGHPRRSEELRRLLPPLVSLADLNGPASSRFADRPRATGDEPMLGRLGDFRLIREVGRGGMGVVYEAVQESLGRRVALKILPFAAALDERRLQRFKLEATAAAQLHHEHIVPVFGVGCERGVHYYAMQFIDGRSLADAIRELRSDRELAPGNQSAPAPQLPGEPSADENPASEAPVIEPPPGGAGEAPTAVAAAGTTLLSVGHRCEDYTRTVARLGIQAAEALDHAHGLGILHRDVKPGNLLLDGRGNLWVTDFGVARLGTEAGLTLTGDLLGTLRYMSPEQTLGNVVTLDYRSDVYSLGVTLYELLTLEPAWSGRDREQVLRQIAFEEPRPPRALNPAIPADLETVVLKAMAKESRERYASARELANDLKRFLEHRPIRARRPSPAERAAKWVRRNRAVARLTIAFLVLTVAGLASGVALLFREQEETHRQRDEARAAEVRATERGAALRQQLYALDIGAAHRAWLEGDLPAMAGLLDRCRPAPGEEDLRGFEWRHLDRLLRQDDRPPPRVIPAHSGDVYHVAYSPDGRSVASAGKDGNVCVWDTSDWSRRLHFRASDDEVDWVAFDREGKRLATVGDDGLARVWDAATGRLLLTLTGHKGEVVAAEFTHDPPALVTAGHDGYCRVWKMPGGELSACYQASRGRIEGLAVSPDGHTLTIALKQGTAAVRDFGFEGKGECRFCIRYDKHSSGGIVSAVAFAPDGRTVAYGTNAGTIELFRLSDAVTEIVLQCDDHYRSVSGLTFSPDGRVLASCGIGAGPRLWDVRTGTLLACLDKGDPGYWNPIFSPDGKTLIVGGTDGLLRVYDLPAMEEPHRLPGLRTNVCSIDFDPIRATLAAASTDGKFAFWDARDGYRHAPQVMAIPPLRRQEHLIRFEPGTRVLAVAESSGLWRWNLDRRCWLTRWHGAGDLELSISYRPGQAEWAAAGGGELVRWAAATGKSLPVPFRDGCCSLPTWSPDGEALACLVDEHLHIYHAASGKVLVS